MKNKKLFGIILVLLLLVVAIIIVITAISSKNRKGDKITNYEITNNKISGKVSYKEKMFNSNESKPVLFKKVNDGYLVVFEINIVSEDDVYSSDARIAKYDSKFNEEWKYDYIWHKELKDLGVDKEGVFSSSVSDIEEKDDIYHIVFNIADDEGNFDSALLAFDKKGDLYKDEYFVDKAFDVITDISKDIITLSEVNKCYKYSISSGKLITKKVEVSNKNEMKVIDKDDSYYYAYSYINYYMDENDEYVVEGDNSFYLLNEDFKITKKISLDKAIGIKVDDKHGVDYGTIKRIGDKFYLPYNTTLITDESEDPDYYGLLVIDKDLNNTYNIKYNDKKYKNKIESIFGFEIYNNKLYVFSELADNYIMIEIFDNNYKRISSDKIEIDEFDKYKDSYSCSEKEIIGMDDNGFVFNQIFDDDNENLKKAKSYLRIYSIKY